MGSELIRIIASSDAAVRNLALDQVCSGATLDQLLAECNALDGFRRASSSLYERVRALFFLSAIYRYYIPPRLPADSSGKIEYEGYVHLQQRRFEEALRSFRGSAARHGLSETLTTALAAGCRGLAFQTLSDQVRRSVRSVRGNRWMFRVGHPMDHPLTIRQELLQAENGLFPVLAESTPVRMDLSHSGWSDIFFLGMDYPEGARVLNISVDLAVRGTSSSGSPVPPVNTWFRVIDEPVLRLVSVDLGAETDVTTTEELFDFGRDYLGLLKAAVIASGLIPPGLEGSRQPLAPLLARLTGREGLGIELVTSVRGIPKGSRLAVSTNLLASLIAVCMRATRQIHSLSGPLEESERRHVAARAILGEWLGGSGGGWQDSGGVWPGVKLISGVLAGPDDPEFGISRGCLLPRHRILDEESVPAAARRSLQDSLVLVHGGMAQDVGPILEMVTERYLLRSSTEWEARQHAQGILNGVLDSLRSGNIQQVGAATQANYSGPIQTIIPWAGNAYTDQLISAAQSRYGSQFWGFWMLGGMAGGGMGFVFDPAIRPEAQEWLAGTMVAVKRTMEAAVPFGMDPVVYDFAINEHGTVARLHPGSEPVLPSGYYALRLPRLVRRELRSLPAGRRAELQSVGAAARTRPDMVDLTATLIEHLLPRESESQSEASSRLDTLLSENGFDSQQHEIIRAELRRGQVGLAQNALPLTSKIQDVGASDIMDIRNGTPEHMVRLGEEALRSGMAGLVTLAGGAGSRWTGGAGVVKAMHPFIRFDGQYRTFIEIHLAKNRTISEAFSTDLPHIVTTSYLTHEPIRSHLESAGNYGFRGQVLLSPGRSVGLRMIPMVRDLRFLWEQSPQILDVQKQKMRDSIRAALIGWAESAGQGSDYRDNLPAQCMHPVGHWYEFPNMLLNGTLHRLLEDRPQLKYLLLHNVDTLGVQADPASLGVHIASGAAMTVEVIARGVDDRGGGLARVDGRPRLVEGLALPDEKLEFDLSFYNSGTMWLDIDKILAVFELDRNKLGDSAAVLRAVRALAARMPSYITIKDVKKRWGRGQEDVYPVSQFEKIWGDMTALPDLACQFAAVSRRRGQQLKQVAQLDGWVQDGSADWVRSLCTFAKQEPAT